MKAYMGDFLTFLESDLRFRVPVYQRNYDWTTANAARLFDDIEVLVSDSNQMSTHFMGAVCFKMCDMYHLDLVDGQQRVTSIALFVRAVAELLGDKGRAGLLGTLLTGVSFTQTPEENVLKLSLNKGDDAVWQKLFFANHDVVVSTLTDAQRARPIWVNYEFFLDKLRDAVSHGGNLMSYYLAVRRLTFVKLEVDVENPQDVFESLNSTGLDLTDVDLLRNSFLMPFPHDEQTRLYDAYWHPMESLFGSRDMMVDFFVDYLVLRNKSNKSGSLVRGKSGRTISKRSLYDAFRGYHDTVMSGDTERMFADMLDVARLYAQTVFDDGFNFMASDVAEWRRFVFIGGLVVKQRYNRAVLLHVLEQYEHGVIDDDMMLACVRLIMSLVVRGRICGRSVFGTQSSGNVLARLEKDTSDTLVKALEKAFSAGRGSYAVPVDAEVREVLTQSPVYEKGLRAQGLKALFYGLEWCSHPKGLPRFDDGFLSIEHIMPQRLNDEWRRDMTESSKTNHAVRLHMLGNLALTNQNVEMSNKSFSDKKRMYAQSNYAYTRELSGKTSWQDFDISQRGQRLCKAVLSLWALPSGMCQGFTGMSRSVSLSDAIDDTALIVSRKLLSVYVGDKSLTVKSWSGMVSAVVNVLDGVDHEALVRCVKRGVSGVFKVEGDKVLVVRKGMSSGTCVKAVGHLVAAFDKEAGTELYGTVGFEFVTHGQKIAEKSVARDSGSVNRTNGGLKSETKVSDKVGSSSDSGSTTDAKSNPSIKYPQVGSRIRHRKFGYGDVVRIEGDVVHVRFHTGNELRKLLYDSVEKGIFEVL